MASDATQYLEMRSPYDGSSQRAVLRLPAQPLGGPTPLVVAPHPFGWTVDEDYDGGCPGIKATRHSGWRGVATDLGVAILQPMGHHRRVPGCSLGFEAVICDIPSWLQVVDANVTIDRQRVYACGLSMGGLESLLAAAHLPDVFAAAFVFNPVVDVARWHDDLATTPIEELREEGGARRIALEVGGRPSEVPDLYRARTPMALLSNLARVPLTIWWSRVDSVVPGQATHHGKHLFDALKATDPAAPVSEYDHTSRYGYGDAPTLLEGWAIHESSDYRLAARWLLAHRRGGQPTRTVGATAASDPTALSARR